MKNCLGISVLLIFMVAVLGMCYQCFNSTSDDSVTKTPEALRKERIEKAFSSWDGSHRNLEAFVKESMNDPESYEHNSTNYRQIGQDTIFVMMSFRGKNAFGGVVKQTVTCYTDLDGNLISLPRFIR